MSCVLPKQRKKPRARDASSTRTIDSRCCLAFGPINSRVSIRLARPEVRRACESLAPFASSPRPSLTPHLYPHLCACSPRPFLAKKPKKGRGGEITLVSFKLNETSILVWSLSVPPVPLAYFRIPFALEANTGGVGRHAIRIVL